MPKQYVSAGLGSPNRRARRSSASRRALWAAAIAAYAATSRPARAADVYYYNLTPPDATSSPVWNTTGLSYSAWYDQTTNTFTGTLQPPSGATARVMLNGTIGVSNSTIVFNSFYGTGSAGLFTLTIDSGNTISQNAGTSQQSVTGSEILGQNSTYGTETIGLNGTGTYIQSGGTHVTDNFVLGSNAGSVGTYSLSGGVFTSVFRSPLGAIIGNAGTGRFNQSGGTVNGFDFLLGGTSGGVGTYNLSGGTATGTFDVGYALNSTGTLNVSNGATLSATDVNIGRAGAGTLNQTGGTFSGSANSFVDVGGSSTGTGLWKISGGTSTLNTAFVGSAGNGSLQLSSGTLHLLGNGDGQAGILYAAYSGGTGNVAISGGALTVDFAEYIGYFSGQATYIQSAGTNTTPYFGVGDGSSGIGVVTFSGGLLSSGTTGIFNGSFFNSGGTHLATTLQISSTNALGAIYTLAGGNLSVTNETIGDGAAGTFTQTSGFQSVGTNSTGALYIGKAGGFNGTSGGNGTFNLSGGTTTASRGVYVGYSSSSSGTVNQTGGVLTIPAAAGTNSALYIGYSNGASGVFNLSGSSTLLQVLGTGGESVGFGGGTGTFNQSGGSNTVATTLSITGISRYNLSDGTLSVPSLQFFGTAFNQSGGTATISSSLVVGTQTYSLSNGAVLAVTGSEMLATSNANATFLQTGGLHSISGTMTLGAGSFGRGTYNLLGGQLLINGALTLGGTNNSALGVFNATAGELTVIGTIALGGNATSPGFGIFNQSGGSISASSLTLWSTASTYSMSNGASLDVTGTESVGAFDSTGSAIFNQNGGSHVVGTLNIGATNGAVGKFTLAQTAGASSVLSVIAAENIAEFLGSTGTFTQTDGSHFLGSSTARANLNLGGAISSVGTYDISGGTLDVSGDMQVGAVSTGNFSLSATANVTVEGGTNSAFVDHGLTFGHSAGSKGNGTMTGGTLTTLNTFVGASGSGLMNQSGGTHHAGSLIIGYATGSSGTYTLSGGTLLIDGNEQVGASGRATFTQSAGTHTVGGTLSIKANSTGSGTFTLQNGVLSTATLANNGTFSVQNGSFLAAATINNSSFTQSGGTSSLGAVSGTGTVTLTGSAASTSVDSVSQAILNVTAGRLTFNSAGASATNLASYLSIGAGGIVDLNNQNLLTSATSTILQYLTSGYNHGSWNGTSAAIVSTAAAQSSGSSTRTLGYATAGVDPVAPSVSIPAGDTLVKYTVPGDADLSGTVDFNDFLALQNGYNQPGDWAHGDFDYSGTIDFNDYLILQNSYGHTLGGNNLPLVAPALTVPEPSGLAAIMALSAAMLQRRRSRRTSGK